MYIGEAGGEDNDSLCVGLLSVRSRMDAGRRSGFSWRTASIASLSAKSSSASSNASLLSIVRWSVTSGRANSASTTESDGRSSSPSTTNATIQPGSGTTAPGIEAIRCPWRAAPQQRVRPSPRQRGRQLPEPQKRPDVSEVCFHRRRNAPSPGLPRDRVARVWRRLLPS